MDVLHQSNHWPLRNSWLWRRIEPFFSHCHGPQLLSLSFCFKMCWLGPRNVLVRPFINSLPAGSPCDTTSSGKLFLIPCTLSIHQPNTLPPFREDCQHQRHPGRTLSQIPCPPAPFKSHSEAMKYTLYSEPYILAHNSASITRGYQHQGQSDEQKSASEHNQEPGKYGTTRTQLY